MDQSMDMDGFNKVIEVSIVLRLGKVLAEIRPFYPSGLRLMAMKWFDGLDKCPSTYEEWTKCEVHDL